ncbi:hypothetical protein RB595_000073 [Gaeumannomyces hyphopodioides]
MAVQHAACDISSTKQSTIAGFSTTFFVFLNPTQPFSSHQKKTPECTTTTITTHKHTPDSEIMDFGGNKNNNTMASGQPAAGTEKADFGDKGETKPAKALPPSSHSCIGSRADASVPPAFDFAAKKAGHPVNRNTGEKITDAARNAYEKATGKKVNPKISN